MMVKGSLSATKLPTMPSIVGSLTICIMVLLTVVVSLEAAAAEKPKNAVDSRASAATQESKSQKRITTTKTPKHHPREKSWIKRNWGVDIMYVRQTAGGYMLEFRYKVVDPKKAAPLFARQTKPILVHQRSGARLVVPTPAKTGALRNSNKPKADHVYWMFFANPGKLIKPGEMVNIEIGNFEAKNIPVLQG